MVLMQHNKVLEPKVVKLRKGMFDRIGSKGDTMTKLGAILGAGILDAGGRHVNITLLTQAGFKKMGSIVGMAVFLQFWYWYPFVHFLSLSFTPTAMIGLNSNIQMPKGFKVRSAAPPSHFAFPAIMEIKKAEKKKEKITAVLSVS